MSVKLGLLERVRGILRPSAEELQVAEKDGIPGIPSHVRGFLQTAPVVTPRRFPREFVEPPYHARVSGGEVLDWKQGGYQVPEKGGPFPANYEPENPGKMPLREARLRRELRDKTSIRKRVERFKVNSRFQGMVQTELAKPKFTKDQTFYVDLSIYPFLTCQNCPWWLAPETQPDRVPRCVKVSEKGGSEVVNGEGTCTLFDSGPGRTRLVERAYGRGEGARGVLPQKIRQRLMPLGRKFVYPVPGQ